MAEWIPELWLPLGAVVAGVWGLLWGSFANVVIHRLPLGVSLVHPGSRCPQCESPIRAWQNIPVLSWLALRGRCANCKTGISVRYPLVEAACGVLAAALWLRYGGLGTPEGVLAAFVPTFFFVLAIVISTFIDLDYRIIPHEITIPMIVTGVAVSFPLGEVRGVTWQESAIGTVLGGGIIWLVIQLYFWIRKREGMGGGDFMLLAAIGAWLGYDSILFVFFGSSMQGTLFALLLLATRVRLPEPLLLPDEEALPEPAGDGFGAMEMPFGPFLALSALEWLYFEPWISEWLYGMYGLTP